VICLDDFRDGMFAFRCQSVVGESHHDANVGMREDLYPLTLRAEHLSPIAKLKKRSRPDYNEH
jgi:hypothetical protein